MSLVQVGIASLVLVGGIVGHVLGRALVSWYLERRSAARLALYRKLISR